MYLELTCFHYLQLSQEITTCFDKNIKSVVADQGVKTSLSRQTEIQSLEIPLYVHCDKV